MIVHCTSSPLSGLSQIYLLWKTPSLHLLLIIDSCVSHLIHFLTVAVYKVGLLVCSFLQVELLSRLT